MPRKLDRWMKLINILHSRNGLSMQDLKEEFELSDRTIARDIQSLRDAGYPVDYDKNGNTYRIHPSYTMRTLYLGDSEAVALLQVIDAFSRKKVPYTSELGKVREKVVNCLAPTVRSAVDQRMGAIGIELSLNSDIQDSVFKTIEQAAIDKCQIRIKYDGRTSSQEIVERVVDPYGLVLKEKSWYLIAYCHLREEVRIFRPERIVEMEVLDTRFSPPTDFCLQTFFDRSWNIEQGELVNVKLRFLPHIAQAVKKAKYHPAGVYTDMSDGSVLYEITVKGLWEISRWALSFGPGVEVLEPDTLREQVKDMLVRACENYKS